MSIGLFDADKASYPFIMYNLDLMKQAAYYKKHNEIVTFSPIFAPDKYSKFIYRKDYDDGYYHIGLFDNPNIEYGGLAFSNPYYKPLPIEMELCHPDKTIYGKWFRTYLFDTKE